MFVPYLHNTELYVDLIPLTTQAWSFLDSVSTRAEGVPSFLEDI